MKKTIRLSPLPALMILSSLAACHKTVTESDAMLGPLRAAPSYSIPLIRNDTIPVQTVPYPQSPVTGCTISPAYGDSILYPQPVGNTDDIVNPNNNPGAGKYLSWPVGLVIDSLTGAINLTKSQTGMRYDIGFVQKGSRDTCLSHLVIAGVSYPDSAYVLSNGATLAVPYFNANPLIPSVCMTGNGCSFDLTGSAAHQGVIVDYYTGTIDLEKTLSGTWPFGGAFGMMPVSGSTFTTTIYYRVNDATNRALQNIQVQLAYYDSKSEIGQPIFNNFWNEWNNLLGGKIITTDSNPRPPLVIIVRHN